MKYLKKNEVINYCEKISYNFIKNNKKNFNKWPILEELLFYIIKRNS